VKQANNTLMIVQLAYLSLI